MDGHFHLSILLPPFMIATTDMIAAMPRDDARVGMRDGIVGDFSKIAVWEQFVSRPASRASPQRFQRNRRQWRGPPRLCTPPND